MMSLTDEKLKKSDNTAVVIATACGSMLQAECSPASYKQYTVTRFKKNDVMLSALSVSPAR